MRITGYPDYSDSSVWTDFANAGTQCKHKMIRNSHCLFHCWTFSHENKRTMLPACYELPIHSTCIGVSVYLAEGLYLHCTGEDAAGICQHIVFGWQKPTVNKIQVSASRTPCLEVELLRIFIICLVKRLVMEAPDAIKWLNELGVEFDKDADGRMVTTHGGGTSRKRMHAAKDYSGAEIMRTLRDEVINRGIPVVEFTSAVELIKDDKGQVAGAVLLNMETGDYSVARAKTVVIATGGAGRMHYQGFPTSNHYGATADGLVLGYRAGASLLYQDSIQYHPTGAIYPSQIMGALVTEKVRSVGAQLVNANGEAYIHPLETRDVNASGVIRECEEGRGVEVPGGLKGVWLDTPMIEILGGEGTIEKRIPAMFRMYMNYGIDMRKVPIVIYPTLHYQNGGLEINGDGFTKEIPNLLVAGEAAGGIHGRNRLMGNSLLDVIVFGRNAGKKAAAKCKNVELGEMNLDHIYKYAEELDKAGVHTDKVSPLLLPKYARHEQR